ncbi:MAG TPA: acyclic terpene utilization AtuA family protein [Ktedonobacterales bacterium]|jgi:hypothetical protein
MLRIGSAQGFYGDDVLKALPMIKGGHVDVVCFEALAELTLAILQKDRLKDPARGFTWDIPIIAEKILPAAYAKHIPLITSGGGLNPTGAADVVHAKAKQLGLHGLKIATVTGDDLLPRLSELIAQGETLANIETGEPLSLDGPPIVTASAYLGAFPIVEALRAGADIVITGRVADPCLYLAPMIHRYGWHADDWSRLASGIVAGHLLECTGQVVGGNSLALVDEMEPEALAHLGYPIAEVEEDGTFVLTKVPNTPGRVSVETAKEQLLYEIHDPRSYITPDVIANFTTLKLTPDGPDRVRVTGVTGKPKTDSLKVNVGRFEGYSRELIFTIGWPKARRKAEQLAGMVQAAWKGLPLERCEIDYLGVNSLYGAIGQLPDDPLELAVRVSAIAKDPNTLKQAVRRMMALGLSGPAGMSVSGLTVGAEPRPLLGLWPALISRDTVQHHVELCEVE